MTQPWAPEPTLEAEPKDPTSPRRWRSPMIGTLALAYLGIVAVVAVLAPVIAPHPPDFQDLYNTHQSPSWGSHLLGTDEFGRDVLSRLMYGARISLLAGLIGTSVALIIGAPFGMLGGYLGGKIEALGDFLFDGLMSIPAIIFALVVIAVLGPGLTNAMIAIGAVISPVFYRLGRAATINIKHDAFIEASVAIGCTRARTFWRHLAPNAVTPIVIQCAVVCGLCIIAEASISYLGLGVRPPTASWGSMLSGAQGNLFRNPYLVYFPGLAIALTVLSTSVLGDWLRDALSTRRRPT